MVTATPHQRRAKQPTGFGEYLQTCAYAPEKLATAGSDENSVSISDPFGGFLVPRDHSAALIQRLYDFSRLANRCRRLPMPKSGHLELPAVRETSRVDGSRLGGIVSGWTFETQLPTTSRVPAQQILMNAHTLRVLIPCTEEVLRQPSALEAFIFSAATEELAVMLDSAIISGAVAQPTGILQDAATIVVTKETSQSADTIVPENVLNMVGRLWPYSDNTAVFLCSRSAQKELLLNCRELLRFAEPNAVGARMSLAGYPLLPVEQCPALGDKGDLMLVDLNEYALAQTDVQSASSAFVRWVAHERVFKFWIEVDGRSIWKEPVAPMNNADGSQSPFVVLEDRA